MAMLCLGFHVLADAKVKLPALVSDGMVLQREQSVKVWGTAEPGECVLVKFLKTSVAKDASFESGRTLYASDK